MAAVFLGAGRNALVKRRSKEPKTREAPSFPSSVKYSGTLCLATGALTHIKSAVFPTCSAGGEKQQNVGLAHVQSGKQKAHQNLFQGFFSSEKGPPFQMLAVCSFPDGYMK